MPRKGRLRLARQNKFMKRKICVGRAKCFYAGQRLPRRGKLSDLIFYMLDRDWDSNTPNSKNFD